MSSTYKGFEIISRLGIGTVLIIRAEITRDEIEKLLGGAHHSLFIVDNYNVELLECESIEGGSYALRENVGTFGGFVKLYAPDKSLILEFEVPISSKLIDTINDIRRKKKIVAFNIYYSYNIIRLGGSLMIRSGSELIRKILPKGEEISTMIFSTEEIDELMKELKYAEFIRFEVPIPLIPEARLDILEKSAKELKNVEKNITKGNYLEAMRICRNIMMNYLIRDKEIKEGKSIRVLTRELYESILNRIPNDSKHTYKAILEGLSETLRLNLEHIHKFIKEDTEKLLTIPSREEAEYIYMMLISILRYISQLIVTWS